MLPSSVNPSSPPLPNHPWAAGGAHHSGRRLTTDGVPRPLPQSDPRHPVRRTMRRLHNEALRQALAPSRSSVAWFHHTPRCRAPPYPHHRPTAVVAHPRRHRRSLSKSRLCHARPLPASPRLAKAYAPPHRSSVRRVRQRTRSTTCRAFRSHAYATSGHCRRCLTWRPSYPSSAPTHGRRRRGTGCPC